MKKYKLVQLALAVLFTCMAASAFAQSGGAGSIKGRVLDSTTKEPLKGATISLLNPVDSTLISYQVSQNNGAFSFDKLPSGNYLLQVSFQGYDSYFKHATTSLTQPVAELGTINMQQEANVLEGIVIKSSPPIVIKKDTTEFNAASFKTRPNAVVEDLLKKLPGLEVDRDGYIKAQGEEVTRVLVDGKRFFSDDPLIATKNLPPDIIEKIQVYDAQSDQSALTGFNDGVRIKTINIITKKNKRKGYFGKAVAGRGNKDLYETSLNLFRFNEDQKISLISQANNINKQSFSAQDIQGALNGGGRSRRSGGGNNANGLISSYAAGLDYSSPWGANATLSSSYLYSKQNTNKDQDTRTQTFVTADTITDNKQALTSRGSNENHRFNVNLESKLNANNTLILRSTLMRQNATAYNYRTTDIVKNQGIKVGNGISSSDNDNSSSTGTVDLIYQHRLKKPGRSFSFAFNGNFNSNDGTSNNYSVNQSYLADGINYTIDTVNQRNYNNSTSRVLNGTITYTEPLSLYSLLELNYNFSGNVSHSERKAFDYDYLSHNYNVLDSALTNSFESINNSSRATVFYRFQYEKFGASLGTGVQITDLSSNNTSTGEKLKQRFKNLYPTAYITYSFARQKSLRVTYDGRTNQPSVTQLQDVTDYSDPLNIKQGNPGLKQSFNHSFSAMYTGFNSRTLRSLSVTFSGGLTTNNITNSVITILDGMSKPVGVPETTPAGATVTRPVNLNGNYNMQAAFNYGIPLKRPKSNFNIGGSLTKSQSVNLQNDTETGGSLKNYTNNYGLSGLLRWTTNLDKNFDVNFTSNSTYNIARYSINSSQNGNFFSEVLSADFTYYTQNGWIFSTDLDYRYYGRGAGYNTSVPLLNVNLAKQIFKEKQGEIKLSVFDLLNQNVSISRSITQNYIQDVQTRTLTRYFMLTFSYSLKKFGSHKIPSLFGGKRDSGADGRETGAGRSGSKGPMF
ncbi:Carboxypeptidase regulatory-like domain-containing protein [Filimonas lacunae]|uniref:Carboxypeptidase regulatory-like domain-containing protein n=1 Tax=Filimonas lacunae TaxID=477680 RepID=A0A173MQH8_9BACT|nr:outer membrane beta-barrel family protein [Filimonas lacunae]BAV09631.1 hypothetical protein FLA_5682 [Filimonas lacunae]SIS76203.1 Carboxypeptidase regulatory-like domain-containing protein [Filimonas lacunae]